jgi:hypothetical protein
MPLDWTNKQQPDYQSIRELTLAKQQQKKDVLGDILTKASEGITQGLKISEVVQSTIQKNQLKRKIGELVQNPQFKKYNEKKAGMPATMLSQGDMDSVKTVFKDYSDDLAIESKDLTPEMKDVYSQTKTGELKLSGRIPKSAELVQAPYTLAEKVADTA